MVSPTLYHSQHISPHHRTKLKSFKIIAYNHESPLNFYTNAHMKNMLYYATDDYFNVLVYCCVEDAGARVGLPLAMPYQSFIDSCVCECVCVRTASSDVFSSQPLDICYILTDEYNPRRNYYCVYLWKKANKQNSIHYY